MTPLDRPVTRLTRGSRDGGRLLVVTLEPGDTIAVRHQGCRRVWRLPVLAVFHAAVKQERASRTRARAAAKVK